MGLFGWIPFSAKKSVLVVDDDDLSLEATAMLIERLGYRAFKARNGAEAISQGLMRLPNLIILDVHMPGKSGWEVLKALRAAPTTKKIPVVMLTGVSGVADANKSFELGANGYLLKPVDSVVLGKQVAGLIGKP